MLQDALAFAFQVLELATVQAPAEDGQDQQDQASGQRNQQVEAFHVSVPPGPVVGRSQRAARSAFNITNSELLAMPRPAAHGGNHPASASGIQTAL